MTDLATTFSQELEESRETVAAASVTSSTETQAVITEQQVLFSTAAAVALPPARTRRFSDAAEAVASAVRGWLASAAKPATPAYPKRQVWLENALMAREMNRL